MVISNAPPVNSEYDRHSCRINVISSSTVTDRAPARLRRKNRIREATTQANVQQSFPFHLDYTSNSGREMLWVVSMVHRAVSLYWSDELGTEYRVEADTTNMGGIALVHRTQDTARFRPAFRDGFRSGGNWLTFVRDRRGRVTGCTLSSGRVRKVVFSRLSGHRSDRKL